MIKASYSAPEVVEMVPYLDYSRLDYWSRIGVRSPSVADSSGRGTKREYSFWDVVVLRVLALLRHEGYGLRILRVVNYFLDKNVHVIPSDPTYALFIISGEILAITEDPARIVEELTKKHDIACIIPLGRIMIELKNEGEKTE